MKFSKLLVLSALWLGIAGSAKAEVPDGIWAMPEPSGLVFTDVTFDDYQRYYLYNADAKMFFASGNEWSTRASVATFGYEVWLVASSEVDAPEGSYELWDNCQHPDRILGDKNCFTDDGGSTWVDHADQGNYSWSVTKVGDFYRFQNVALIADKPEFDGKYFGWKGDYSDSRLYMIAPEEGFVDWKFVTADSYLAFVESDAYAAYKSGAEAFAAALALKKVLEQAEALGANIATQLAVYTNTASTAAELNAAASALTSIIDARKALKEAIDDAKAKGFTETAPYEAVFANGDATADELKKALEDLKTAMVEWGKNHASVDNPADMTAKIVNPNFDNASSSGWSGTAPNMKGSGSHGPANVAEVWNNTFDTYQDIEGLPAGVYALGAKTSWRGSWNDMINNIGPAASLYVKVGDIETAAPFNYIWSPMNTEALGGSTYFGTGAGENAQVDEETGITYYSPNDPSAFRLYEEKGFYDTKVMFGVSEGTVRIGVKNPRMMGDADNWSCFDTFTLTYYGAGADAAKLYLDLQLPNYKEFVPEEGQLYTEAYAEEYNKLIAAEYTAASMEEASAIVKSINDAYNALMKNIDLWKQWQEKVNTIRSEYVVNDEYAEITPEIDNLSDYCDEFNVEEILEAHDWTNEKLEEELATLDEWVESLLEKSKDQVWDGKDMTMFINNPSFEKDHETNSGNKDGWTVDRIDGGNVTPGPINGDGDTFLEKVGYYNACFESWHCHKWDVWQEIKNLPVGMYELQVQGYVRCEVGGYNRGDELVEPYTSPVYLYMNNATSQFPSVYSEIPAEHGVDFQIVEGWTTEEINGNLFPNSMGGAAQCFSTDMYKKTAFGLIAKKGDTFRIGVKMDADQDWWCIWDNFKLTYRKPTADLVLPVLDEAMQVINPNQFMGKSVHEAALALEERVNAAKASGDGQAMFDMLAEVYDLSESISNSVALFKKLIAANENLIDVQSYSSASAAVKDEAKALYNRINDGVEAWQFEDAEVEGLMAEIGAMITKLGIPADADLASDANPVEFKVIKNPDYDEDLSGWLGTGAARNADWTNAEIFNANFDYYQDIIGLPEGTYQLMVQGFYRAGSAKDDYDKRDDESISHAFLYALTSQNGDSITFSKPLVRLGAEADELNIGVDGYVTVVEPSEESNGVAVCNSMATAGQEFEYGKYNNNLIFKVKAGENVRVGLKKNVNINDNWTIWDSWKLMYFGKNSDKTPAGDPSGIENVNSVPAVQVEYFTLDGRKANSLQKGIMIQKVTFENGAVLVKKIRK